jgi:hypothetical protein
MKRLPNKLAKRQRIVRLPQHLYDYRNHLVNAEQKAQEDFDKTVISLSGGALGVSFAFVKDIVGPAKWQDSSLLLYAWESWGISIIFMLFSYYISLRALRKAIQQVDNADLNKSPGGAYGVFTDILTIGGAILFIVGVAFLLVFITKNLEKSHG